MANDTVTTVLKDNSVSTAKIVDKAVTHEKLADGAVEMENLSDALSDVLALSSFETSKFQLASSVSELPAYSNTIGWIVNNHLYLYTGDDNTHVYTDCGELRGPQGIQGEKGEKGEQGDKGNDGDRGPAGLHISDIEQPIVSDKDEGINIIRITRSDGKEFSFQMKNGSRGSQGTGISKITQTSTSKIDGGENIITFTLTDGSSYNIKTYNGTGRNKGYYYPSLAALKAAVPNPSVSDWAIVGGDIYVCDTAGVWTNTGYSWKGTGIDDSSTGSVALGSLLTALNTLGLPSTAAYLHWNGVSFNWQNPTTSSSSGDGSTSSNPVSLLDYSWWGSSFDEGNNNIFNKPLSGVKGLTLTNGTNSILMDVDNDGNLRVNGNVYATGGVTALGSGGSSAAGSTTLGTFLTDLNNANPTPEGTGNNEVLVYKGGTYTWQDLASAASAGIKIKNNSSIITNSSGDELSCTSLNFIFPDTLTDALITRTSDSEVKIDLSKLGSASLGTLLTAINKSNPIPTSSGQVLTYNGSGYSWTTPSTSSSGSGTVDLTGYATQSWVRSQGYLTSHQSLSSYATQTWVSNNYASKSHSHSTSDISGLSSYIQSTKVNSATSADSATKLVNTRTIWGQNFNGTSNITGSLISVTSITMSDAINMGDGKIEWDSTNKAFKITGNLYVTGGITCLSS